MKKYKYKYVDNVILFEEIMSGKETGELNENGINIITKMTNIAADKYVERKEGIRLSKTEKQEMVDFALNQNFEKKLWSKVNPDKLGKDKYSSIFSYVMQIILCSFGNYIGKLARKKIYERERVSQI